MRRPLLTNRGSAHVREVSMRVYVPILASVQEMGHVAKLTGMNIMAEIKSGGVLEGLAPDLVPSGSDILVEKVWPQTWGAPW